MRARVIEVFNSCSNDIKSNFQNVLVDVKRWLKGLKSSSDDTSFQKYITGKFRSHVEFGQHQEPIQDIDDIGDRILLIEFSQGEFKKYDISNLLSKEMFAPLRNLSFFKNFKIESGGYGLVWNEDIDISEYELWKNGGLIYAPPFR